MQTPGSDEIAQAAFGSRATSHEPCTPKPKPQRTQALGFQGFGLKAVHTKPIKPPNTQTSAIQKTSKPTPHRAIGLQGISPGRCVLKTSTTWATLLCCLPLALKSCKKLYRVFECFREASRFLAPDLSGHASAWIVPNPKPFQPRNHIPYRYNNYA